MLQLEFVAYWTTFIIQQGFFRLFARFSYFYCSEESKKCVNLSILSLFIHLIFQFQREKSFSMAKKTHFPTLILWPQSRTNFFCCLQHFFYTKIKKSNSQDKSFTNHSLMINFTSFLRKSTSHQRENRKKIMMTLK